ncbi:lysine N(6)-hydroxylase/L-ornithine N(5)-oxygenase family protein [Kribbella sandramycini]|uniref:L-lysine N6-monooxygenase MbtG n=1 Tax=Kribbella sandramycini TaxID=60450 RepID=A0A7Y4KX45_9ACTN|nr:lysine N(6)-hydroxylase/L-ornithine N(5)-oxygenase family protein [Kribbella sandramycini]MBB6569893.1 L-ornithine N5-oxygenase [Kribbella sandramycini]NOL40282.1 lysine N(6)-hydroxylase/L-ornithine N(5)-oxygenase family protein [Kribbella sandramycini]
MASHVQDEIFDLIGVGFGPSNLAVAIAAGELGDTAPRRLFLERQPRFGWHRGMLIDDATMQVSFLKDLVTLRNPASPFTFLSFLHQTGRLIDFVNHKTLFPLRVEFHDYLEWAAAQLPDVVRYDRTVVSVDPVSVNGVIAAFDVTSTAADGSVREVHRTRNLILGTGLTPRLPEGVMASARVWHNRDLLDQVRQLGDDAAPRRVVVVGAGQSAAEVTSFLHERFPAAEICSVFSRYGYSPADDSPFANRVFDPAAVDEFYSAPEDVKQQMLDYHSNTNYSVVDTELIEDLYRRSYRERVAGRERLRFFNVARVTNLREHSDGLSLTVESLSTGQKTPLDADLIVYCTGYRAGDAAEMLGDLGRECRRDPYGRLRIGRDYRVETTDAVRAGIYLQGGGTEHTHGLASSLLSNTAVRAGEILTAIQQQPVRELRPHALVDGSAA